MDVERLLRQAHPFPDDEVLGMILSNRIDQGDANGGLIHSSQFATLVQDLLAWQRWSNARTGASPAGPGNDRRTEAL